MRWPCPTPFLTSLARSLALALLVVLGGACSEDLSPVAATTAAGDSADFIIFRPPPDQFVEITAGEHHTCARRLYGAIYCWGRDELRQVGIDPTTRCTDAAGRGPVDCVDRPRRVTAASFSTVSMVDAGMHHTCALTTAGTGVCWGANNWGQVGMGVHQTATMPTPVTGGRTYTSISAGSESSCATSSAGMFCWGRFQGSAPNPTLVSTFNSYSRVTVGAAHACAFRELGTHRVADCWGNNSYGQVGIAPVGSGPWPFTVGSGTGTSVLGVVTEHNTTCVNQPTSRVQCFGDNSQWQLGRGTTVASDAIAQNVSDSALTGVSIGRHHACAVAADWSGYAFCWGRNLEGQLGDGSTVSHANMVVRVQMPGGVSVRAIAAGGYHSCAIGSDDRIYCWGANRYGQLGRGFDAYTTRLVLPTITPG